VFGENDVRFFFFKIKAFFLPKKRKEVGYAFSKLGEPDSRYRIYKIGVVVQLLKE
jgi:hypothetical protein